MHITLHLSTACNMRCDYCYAPPCAGDAMSENTAFQALQLGASTSKNNQSCGVIFFGGEPLLHQSLIDSVISRARAMTQEGSCPFHFKLTTNGLLLNETFLQYAVRNDIALGMSFDGIAQAHNRHRHLVDGAPSFDILVQKLELLLRFRPYSSILTVVNPDTAAYLAESVRFLLDRGARYLIVSLNFAASWSSQDLDILKEQYESLAGIYLAASRAGKKFYLSPFEVKLASHICADKFQADRCALGRRQVSIDPTGFIFPCVQFNRAGPDSSFCIGHVSSGIDESKRSAIEVASTSAETPCETCDIRKRCNHTCGCLNWQSTGDPFLPSDALCAHEQLLIPIVDRLGNALYQEKNPLFLHKHYNPAYPLLSLLEDSLNQPKLPRD